MIYYKIYFLIGALISLILTKYIFSSNRSNKKYDDPTLKAIQREINLTVQGAYKAFGKKFAIGFIFCFILLLWLPGVLFVIASGLYNLVKKKR